MGRDMGFGESVFRHQMLQLHANYEIDPCRCLLLASITRLVLYSINSFDRLIRPDYHKYDHCALFITRYVTIQKAALSAGESDWLGDDDPLPKWSFVLPNC
jgi:hypothetical protein